MKSFLTIALFSALLGLGLGVVVAYFEVPPNIYRDLASNFSDDASNKPEATAMPKAEVPELVYKFGNIEQGASMSHEFVVRNVGQKPLTVDVASTTCKCTVGDLAENVIAPNSETKVLLEWVAKQGPGPFRHGAVLATNDPTQLSINLSVEGLVVLSTALSVPNLTFGAVPSGESATAELYLMGFLDEEIKVLDYKMDNQDLAKQIDIQIVPAEKSELPSSDATSALKIIASYQPGKTIGPFRDWLMITTNQKMVEKLTIPIIGTVVGDISIYGPGWNQQKGLLRMGSIASKAGKTVSLRLSVRGEYAKDAEFEIAEVDPPQLKVSLGESRKMGEKLSHMPLVVEVPVGSEQIVRLGEPISSDAHIMLRSKHPEISDVNLRVQFAVE